MIENQLKNDFIFHIRMTKNKIDLQTNNYLSKNNNFLPSAPPKHNTNLLKNEIF